ncbi:MAG: PmoA family protein [Planctomycetota bacterium]
MIRIGCLLMSLAAVLWTPSVVSSADTVDLKQSGTTIDITVNGKPFATYHVGDDLPKPFLLPVRTPSGVVANRALGDTTDADHPHHKGMWNAVDEVNKVKFWAEKGPIRNTSVQIISTGSTFGQLKAVNEWRHPESAVPQLTEQAIISFYPNHLIVYDMTLTASHIDVTFEDTKEGLFGFRVAPSMKEKNGGQVISSDGTKSTKECWGKPWNWVDYSGTVDGKTIGVTMMDHPKNFRPSRYHVRDYGLFSISPFGESAYTNGANPAAEVKLFKGESLHLRYGLYVHDGDTESGRVADVWRQFLTVE